MNTVGRWRGLQGKFKFSIEIHRLSKISTVNSESAYQNTHFELVDIIFFKNSKKYRQLGNLGNFGSNYIKRPMTRPPGHAPGLNPSPSCRSRRELSNGGVESSVDRNLTLFRPVQSPASISKCSLILSFNLMIPMSKKHPSPSPPPNL